MLGLRKVKIGEEDPVESEEASWHCKNTTLYVGTLIGFTRVTAV